MKGIYRVHRFGEENNFEECGIKDNRKLLWHGTKTAHMIGILNHGLQIDPPHAISTGNAYGSVSTLFLFLNENFPFLKHYPQGAKN